MYFSVADILSTVVIATFRADTGTIVYFLGIFIFKYISWPNQINKILRYMLGA
jgi:ABC-type Fe3+-siderophore transport system permease subunit